MLQVFFLECWCHTDKVCSVSVAFPSIISYPPIPSLLPSFVLAKRTLKASLVYYGALTGENATAPKHELFTSHSSLFTSPVCLLRRDCESSNSLAQALKNLIWRQINEKYKWYFLTVMILHLKDSRPPPYLPLQQMR